MTITKGLNGIIAGQTAISAVSTLHTLHYRGYAIQDLVKQASFEEVAFLLIHGELPNTSMLNAFVDRLISYQGLPPQLCSVLEKIPAKAHPMDVLRTGCSFLGTIEVEKDSHQVAERLLAILPSLLMYWHHYHQHHQRIDTNTHEKTIAGHFLKLLQGEINPLYQDFLNVSLMLYAEHEFNVSTFATRVVISTLADFYSGVTAGISALSGPLHGGANEAAMALISQFKNPLDAMAGIKYMLNEKKLIMGFGHRVYKESDPRSIIAKEWAVKLALDNDAKNLLSIGEAIEKTMWDEKHLFPNVDFYTALCYHFCKIPSPFFTPLFVFSRITGWSAHIIEQRNDNKIIRPAAEYIGPAERKYIPIDNR